MLKVVNYVRGHVRVEVEGAFPERFLNICSQNGIAFWNLERMSQERLRAMMHTKDFKRVRPFAKRSLCSVSLLEKRGVPFFFIRFRKRYALFLGLALFVAAVYVFSLFIWDVEVTGAQSVSTGRILYYLARNGVKAGTYTASIDHDEVANRMLLDIEELSWIAINVKGSRATVEVRERIPAPEILPKDTPCNVVAAKAGLITSMEVLAGSPQVVAGQTVKKGQLLVSGVIDSEKVGARFVHAMADVKARTWYAVYGKMPLKAAYKEYTGAKKTRRALIFGGKRINIYFNTGKPFDTCDKIIKKTQLSIFRDVPLPVTLVTEEYLAYNAEPFEIPAEEAERMIRERLEESAASNVGDGTIEEKGFESLSGNGVAAVKMTCEAEERIAREAEMPAAAYAQEER